jgi:hypothetical protein
VALSEKDIIRSMRCLDGWRARRALMIACVVCLMALELGCNRVSRMLGRDYEYEEDVTLSVDGSATINVNASLAALVALRGLALDPNPRVRFESEKVRTAFEAAGCTVTRVSSTPWIRDGRRFVQIRMDLRDIRQASKCGPLAWSTYTFTQDGESIVFRQVVGMPPSADASGVKWTGQELIGFKLHLPSKIISHNVRDVDTNEPLVPERGNILTWEQRMATRRLGTPLVMEMRMERESILYRTLWLFAGAFLLAITVMGAGIAWTLKRRTAKT